MSNTIKITKAKEEPGAVHLAVSVPPDHVEQAEVKAAHEVRKSARLKGFRKGKAPLHVIRRQFKDVIRESVIRDLVKESWETALEQESLKPIADPHVHNLKFDRGEPITFDIHVEIKPELTLSRLGNFKVERPTIEVTDDMVAAKLQDVREQHAPWSPITDEKPKPKDLVHITLETIEKGKAKDPQPYHLVLGEGRAIPDVEETIMTLVQDESTDATVRFPDDFAEEGKRGTSREVRITLHEVKRQELPELSDDFAREVGDFETLDDLRQSVRDDLQAETEREIEARVRQALIDKLAEANQIEAPTGLVERALLQLAQASGVTEENWERFRTELHPVAAERVKRDLILEHVAEHEGLKATEEELDERIAELAEKRNMKPGELYAQLEKAKRLRSLERDITDRKVFDHLLSLSTIE